MENCAFECLEPHIRGSAPNRRKKITQVCGQFLETFRSWWLESAAGGHVVPHTRGTGLRTAPTARRAANAWGVISHPKRSHVPCNP